MVPREDYEALLEQLEGTAPSHQVHEGIAVPAPEGEEPTGWETEESIRGGLTLIEQYDSDGDDAWDVSEHPNVWMTSEGRGYPHRLSETNQLPGVQVVDSDTYETIASASFDLGFEQHSEPHGLGVSPDGEWIYIGTNDSNTAFSPSEGENRILIINARTLKLDKVLEFTGNHSLTRAALHHIQGFWDYNGEPRVVLNHGFGADGGPHFILDPSDDNRVVKAITFEDVHPMGHPYTTPSPDGRYLYISMGSPSIRSAPFTAAGIAKYDLEGDFFIEIPYVGNHPIGIMHTSDSRYTYVIEGHNSYVYKIDNALNEVVNSTSAGVAGPYGLVLNWGETQLWTVGKGEGTHNVGGVLGVIDTQTFSATREFNQPVNIEGAIMDHATLHPDPDRNEIWVTSAGTFETIVVDTETREVIERIPTPNGGDTHSGAFVEYDDDWNGELLFDMGGAKSPRILEMMRDMSEHPFEEVEGWDGPTH